MLPLRIYGTTSRQYLSSKLRRCVAQPGPAVGVVKLGGGMSTWKRSFQSSGKLSRHGRLVKALGRHTMQPNAFARRAVHHARQKADKEIYKKTDPKSSEIYRLANQFRREHPDVVGDKPVKNDAGEMSVSKDS